MTDSVADVLLDYAPHPRKSSPTGFIKFNCPLCVQAGEPRPDTKFRGGIKLEPGVVSYNCFNCGTGVRWSQGEVLSRKMLFVLRGFGASEDRIRRLTFDLFRSRQDRIDKSQKSPVRGWRPEYEPVPLPEGARPLLEWLQDPQAPEDAIAAGQYLLERGESLLSGNWTYYWSPSDYADMRHRIIIPFMHDNFIAGWTARLVRNADPSKPRYYTGFKPRHFLFNNAVLTLPHRKYVILCEGPLDAIAIDGVALLGKTMTQEQVLWLKQSGKTVIVLPDGSPDRKNLIDYAERNGWLVSFPWTMRIDRRDGVWGGNVKDAAEAARRYGRLYTVRSIIEKAMPNDGNRFEMMKKRLLMPA